MRQGTDAGAERRKAGLWTRARRVFRRVVGAPDYEAYLEHCRLAGHPPRLDERAFVREFFAAKGRGARCC